MNYPPVLSDETEKDYEDMTDNKEENKTPYPVDLRNEIRTIIQESNFDMVDEVFTNISRDLHIVVCGSPRVGKSTLINVICGKEVAKAKEGLASVTQTIQCYTLEGPYNTGSKELYYKYNFWDTPGFESWEKANIKLKVKEIIEKPETKPLCMIFCASPGTFVDLTQLEWLLNLCINKRHIFCALVCTNMYAGQKKSRLAVLDAFNGLLSKFTNDPPRTDKDVTFYGNVGLCAAVNSEPYEDDDRILPPCGTNELILGIMESLVDEQVLNWCFVVLENQGFWDNCHHKVSGFFDKVKDTNKAIKKIFKKKKKDSAVFFSRK